MIKTSGQFESGKKEWYDVCIYGGTFAGLRQLIIHVLAIYI
jgi:hypothetical protein